MAACTATDVVSILQKKRQIVTDYKVEITGERREEYPRKFTKFHIHHIVYGDNVSEQAVAQRRRAFRYEILLGGRNGSSDGGNFDEL